MQTYKQRLITLLLILSFIFSFGVMLPSEACADDEVIGKILTTLSSTPVALSDPSLITVATSTPGCRISSAGWFDSSGKAVSGVFGVETYTLVINIVAEDGFSIDRNVACYLNNSAISCSVADSGASAMLTRDYTAAVWAPTVYKNPGSETVDEGGWASFVVSGNYVRDYEWALLEPEGRGVIPVANLKNSYSGMDYTGDNSPKLILYHIPYELNGWKVVCDFIGAGDGNVTRSQPATLTVIPTVSRNLASPSPTAAAAASPSPSVPPVTVTAPVTAEPEPDPVTPAYSDTWSYDARGHWHAALDDGPAADEALHSFAWTESDTEPGVEQGVCEVCGFTVTRRPDGAAASASDPAEDSSSGFRLPDLTDLASLTPPPSILMWVLVGLIPLDLLLVIVHLCGPARQRRRRRRR